MSSFKKMFDKFPKDWPTRIILVVLIVLAVVGAVYGYRLSRQIVATNEIFSLPGDPVVEEESEDTEDQEVTATSEATEVVEAELATPEPWDGVSRVNVLVMGLDYRDWEAGETPHSDTMILLTLDPVNNTAGIVSIPRDLWVSIPGFEYAKINTAYYLGEIYNLPGGGAALASETVEDLLGVEIDYYAQIDFQAFIDFIDNIEGVRITFDEPMVLDRLGQWNTVTLEPGTYALPGEYALAYVRSRSTEGADFDRAERQQTLIMAVRDRILEFDMLPTLVANASEIYEDLSAGINTNMSLNEVIQLAWSALEVEREDITQVIINNEYVTLGVSPDGLDILIPIPDEIRLLRDEVFSTDGALGPIAEGESEDLIAEEGANVSIRNGSYQSGLASTTASWLREQGFNVVQEVDTDYSVYSQIYIYDSVPYALDWLADTLGVTSTNIYYMYDPDAEYDLVVVLGDDWAGSNSMQ